VSARYRPVVGEAELVARHSDIAYAIARTFFFAGADAEDVEQEALVGLLYGIRMYEPQHGSSLRSFLGLTVRAWLIAKMKQANKMRAAPLNDAAREGRNDDGELVAILDLLPSGDDPHQSLVWKEELARLVRGMARLSPLERQWITHVLNGGRYSFADKANRNKQAENAIARARLKLREAA
jgi:RNA polymerase sporulation-specific sigma factor